MHVMEYCHTLSIRCKKMFHICVGSHSTRPPSRAFQSLKHGRSKMKAYAFYFAVLTYNKLNRDLKAGEAQSSIVMTTLLLIIACIGLWVWWRMTHYNDPKWLKERFKLKERTDEQKAVLRYFCNDPACLSKKPITDEEYDNMVLKVLNSNDYKQKALSKIGLDEDQVKEIEPVHFEGFIFDDQSYYKLGKDNKYRSTKYQVSWLFFSATQVYLYQNTFNMDEDGKKERTEEYFYKDITNFSTTSETNECRFYDPKKDKEILQNVDTNSFVIIVPGDKFYCSLDQNDYTERAIQGMKTMLREKKSV